LQGQLLLTTYQSNQITLDNDLNNCLSIISNELDLTKIFGKPNRYLIGTVAFIERNNNRYLLTAFNKILSTEKRVTTDISKFHTLLANC
jgi:hypothetical protein